jgi:small GTP-binding protein
MRAKLVLVGSAHTGKTSILNRYIYEEFTPNTVPTVQPLFFQKKVKSDGIDVILEIWDTAGQEQYHALSPLFYRDADLGVVVFDLTDSSSFGKCKQWVSELRDARGLDIEIVLVGNKADLTAIRSVSMDSVEQFASLIQAEVVETSAKSGENVTELFDTLAKVVVKRAVLRDQNKKRVEGQQESGCC